MLRAVSLARQLELKSQIRTVARSALCTSRKFQNSYANRLVLSRNFTSSPETLSTDNSAISAESDGSSAVEYTDDATGIRSFVPVGDFTYKGEGMNGEVFGQGSLLRMHRHGPGKLILKDGTIYEGRWMLGHFEEGTVTLTDGKISQGVWKNKQLSDGKVDYIDVGKSSAVSDGRYRGEIKNGKKWNGAYYAQDGSITRRWVEGKDGAVWEGHWEADAFVKGALTFASGEKLQGTFRAGKVWNAVLYGKEGGVKLRWVNGAAAHHAKHALIVN
eukprot:gene15379-17595_t